VALSHRVVALLRIFIDRAGGPVSKDAPIKAAWPDLAVKDSDLTVQIAALRRFGEAPGGESSIATLTLRAIGLSGPLSSRARL